MKLRRIIARAVTNPRSLVIFGLLIAFLIVVFGASEYQTFQISRVLAFACALLGLNLLTGFSGQVSVGQGAVFGIGAYSAAIVVRDTDVHYLFAVVLAVAVCFALGVVLGIPSLRISGLYLALATVGLAIVLPEVLKKFESVTGGVFGLSVRLPEPVFGLSREREVFFVCVTGTLISALAYRRLSQGRIGRAWDAVRESAAMASTLGIDVARYRVAAFAVSSALAGLGGAMFALVTQFVSPDSFPVSLSISFLAGSVVGGMRYLAGAFLGALFLIYVPEYAGRFSTDAPDLVYAFVLLACVYAAPMGLAGLFARIRARVDFGTITARGRSAPGARHR